MTITAGFDTTVAAMSREEARILAHFAAGESVDQVASVTRLPRAEVALAVDSLAKNNRNLAQNLATAWQRANPGERGQGQPAQLPRPRPPAPVESDPISAKLDRAALSGVARLERLAEKIHDLLDQLEAELGLHERGRALREEQAKLQERLAQIKAELRGDRPASSAPEPEPSGNRAVRAWAAENGIECPARGRVPARVLDAYREAVTA